MALTKFLLVTIFMFKMVVYAKEIVAFGGNIDIPHGCDEIFGNTGEGRNYCSIRPNDYPEHIIDEYIRNKQNDGFPEYYEEPDIEEQEEDCNSPEVRNNCCAKTQTEIPFMVKSEATIKLVIQSQFFQQKIRTTSCAYSNQEQDLSCFGDFELENWGFKTMCRTNHGTSKFYVYNPMINKTEVVTLVYPVSCSCSVLKQEDTS